MLVLVLVLLVAVAARAEDFYDLEATDATGKRVSLAQFRGKVSLVVNVASECGYTDHNYRELVQLQEDLGPQGFTVLAFPCNQFGGQEPGSMKAILAFVRGYGVNFPVFSKVDVDGLEVCDVYSYLVGKTDSVPQWNFCKYLVGRNGEVKQFFAQDVAFDAIRKSVQYLLGRHHEL